MWRLQRLSCSYFGSALCCVSSSSWSTPEHGSTTTTTVHVGWAIYVCMVYNLPASCHLYVRIRIYFKHNLAGSLITMAPDTRRTDPNTLPRFRPSYQVCLLARGATARIPSTTTRRSDRSSTAAPSVETRIYWNPRGINCSMTLPSKLKKFAN